MSQNVSLFATALRGTESLLADELTALGARDVLAVPSGVKCRGTLEVAYRLCLWSRVANRILLPLKSFPAESPDALYQGIQTVYWLDHLSPQGTLAVDFVSVRSNITHTHFGALKVKDAIVDQIRAKRGIRPSVDTARPSVRVNVYLENNRGTVSIDLSGEGLHKRGYRQGGGGAPLKENLAAAILLFAGWPELANEGCAFLDPMCGSGTLPIEAALMATHTAPGINRDYYGFLGWKQHSSAVWKQVLGEAKDRQKTQKSGPTDILACDASGEAIEVSFKNICNAGLKQFIRLEKKPFEKCANWAPKGVVVINPPYGERMGDESSLIPVYKQIGDVFKQNFSGWNGYVFSGNLNLVKSIGLRTSKRWVLNNGAIECRLLKYELYQKNIPT